jgi:hypothetical protein
MPPFDCYLNTNSNPGPGAYESVPAPPSMRAAPHHTFAPSNNTDTRTKTHSCFIENVKKGAYQPGPGAYSAGSSLGRQTDARPGTGQSAAAFSFSRGARVRNPRQKNSQPFITRKHERENLGLYSPSPKYYPGGEAGITGTIGIKARPTKTSPSWGFPRASRF